MKRKYEPLSMLIEYFEEADVVTESETEIDQADGKGYIPESWYA